MIVEFFLMMPGADKYCKSVLQFMNCMKIDYIL